MLLTFAQPTFILMKNGLGTAQALTCGLREMRRLSSKHTFAFKDDRWRCCVSTSSVRLLGNVSEISRGGLYEDHRERITVAVQGAEPLYAELRLPNDQGWTVGQRVRVIIAPAASDESWDSAT
jgi:hypothetical protein